MSPEAVQLHPIWLDISSHAHPGDVVIRDDVCRAPPVYQNPPDIPPCHDNIDDEWVAVGVLYICPDVLGGETDSFIKLRALSNIEDPVGMCVPHQGLAIIAKASNYKLDMSQVCCLVSWVLIRPCEG